MIRRDKLATIMTSRQPSNIKNEQTALQLEI